MPQLRYEKNAVPAVAGQPFDTTGYNFTGVNKDPQAKKIDTVVVDTATDGEEYSVLVEGLEFSTTRASGATQDNLAQDLVDAINADGRINGRVVAEKTATTGQFTVTARNGGIGFTFSLNDNSAKMTLTNTQANAVADAFDFGLGVLYAGQNDAKAGVYNASGVEPLVRLATATALTARTVLLAPQVGDNDVYLLTVTYEEDGIERQLLAEITADGTATAAEIVDAMVTELNADLPANTVIASNVGDELQLLSEVAGKNFSYGFGSLDAVNAGWAVSSDNQESAIVDINDAFAGIAETVAYSEKSRPERPGQLSGNAQVEPNDTVTVKEDGRIWVDPEDTPALTQRVFIRLAAVGSLDTLGGFTATPDAGTVHLKRAKWHQIHPSLSVIQLRR